MFLVAYPVPFQKTGSGGKRLLMARCSRQRKETVTADSAAHAVSVGQLRGTRSRPHRHGATFASCVDIHRQCVFKKAFGGLGIW